MQQDPQPPVLSGCMDLQHAAYVRLEQPQIQMQPKYTAPRVAHTQSIPNDAPTACVPTALQAVLAATHPSIQAYTHCSARRAMARTTATTPATAAAKNTQDSTERVMAAGWRLAADTAMRVPAAAAKGVMAMSKAISSGLRGRVRGQVRK